MSSPHPILEYGYYSGSSAALQTLIDYKPNPERESHINRIEIRTTAASVGVAQFKIIVNNDTIMDMKAESKYLASTVLYLVYAGKLVLDGKKQKQGIRIYVNSDGATTIGVQVALTGVEVEKGG